ncbi:hypothetical protein MLN87_07355 [Escherichia coli]|nr:hypothetical protein [Escherichia coli]HAI3384502.1 hypothetical protein [Escherichia coli]HAL0004640.1 hypothetical protein [Escherichia coli]HAP1523982.1 hypothetical protein [Escherichia coli]HBD0135815.1 hypothetical protein [Escherichia coli]
MTMPANINEWRKRYPDGLNWFQVQHAHSEGLMMDQRFELAYRTYQQCDRFTHRQEMIPWIAEKWRYAWEPRHNKETGQIYLAGSNEPYAPAELTLIPQPVHGGRMTTIAAKEKRQRIETLLQQDTNTEF